MPEPIAHNGEVRDCPSIIRTKRITDKPRKFAVPWGRIADPCRPEAYDDKTGNRLWSWLETEVAAYMK